MLNFVNIIALFIGIVGALVIFVGVVQAVIMLIKYWGTKHRPSEEGPRLDHIRLDLGRYIIIALEFFIAKDIIETLVVPSWTEIGMLAVIVAVRTLLSFFLTKELHQIEHQKIEHRRIDAGLN